MLEIFIIHGLSERRIEQINLIIDNKKKMISSQNVYEIGSGDLVNGLGSSAASGGGSGANDGGGGHLNSTGGGNNQGSPGASSMLSNSSMTRVSDGEDDTSRKQSKFNF
jgi:hypothetical protein